jgi:hypothetical protein
MILGQNEREISAVDINRSLLFVQFALSVQFFRVA